MNRVQGLKPSLANGISDDGGMVVPRCGSLPYAGSTNDIDLPPEKDFAAAAVASGRYRDMGEVVAAGVSLLRQTGAQRDMLLASVDAARAGGERDAFLTLDEVMNDADLILGEMAGQEH